jgi:hypothetical protein
MKSYEFELHRKNQPNELINIEGINLVAAYHTALDLYPGVLGIVSTNPTADII